RGQGCKLNQGVREWLGERDGELERAAAADFALDPDAAAMGFDDALGDEEAETGALTRRRFDLPEALEDARLRLFGDAGAGVGDAEVGELSGRARADADDAAGGR